MRPKVSWKHPFFISPPQSLQKNKVNLSPPLGFEWGSQSSQKDFRSPDHGGSIQKVPRPVRWPGHLSFISSSWLQKECIDHDGHRWDVGHDGHRQATLSTQHRSDPHVVLRVAAPCTPRALACGATTCGDQEADASSCRCVPLIVHLERLDPGPKAQLLRLRNFCSPQNQGRTRGSGRKNSWAGANATAGPPGCQT